MKKHRLLYEHAWLSSSEEPKVVKKSKFSKLKNIGYVFYRHTRKSIGMFLILEKTLLKLPSSDSGSVAGNI